MSLHCTLGCGHHDHGNVSMHLDFAGSFQGVMLLVDVDVYSKRPELRSKLRKSMGGVHVDVERDW